MITRCNWIDASKSNRRILQGEIHHVINPNPHNNYGTSGKVAGFISETIQVGDLTLSIVSISSVYDCFDNLEYEIVKELHSFIFLVNIGSWRSS